ncbi:Chromophore lyase CpcT/CpeT [Porphyridium purpureum]|uniref:Chromophore lyase CpcT/CpeT n=1 Tax=Porphyridium purpureum TaxID=35688 RepID=A0A5J4Z5S5_PORPP|nr:Chromophore lyase CpcT/CpeT [Porphyridium purpureum]|eukprot:POR4455..scf295_1
MACFLSAAAGTPVQLKGGKYTEAKCRSWSKAAMVKRRDETRMTHLYMSEQGPSSRSNAQVSSDQSADAAALYKLGCCLAKDWSNKQQAAENPPLWAHIHVCFRPLPKTFFASQGIPECISFYTESAYDYMISRPYKNSVVRIAPGTKANGTLELFSYKITENPELLFYGSRDRSLLDDFTCDHLAQLPEGCNLVYEWDAVERMYRGYTRPGKQCKMPKGGYLCSEATLTEDHYTSWDTGRDFDTDEILWGAAGGAFDFYPEESFAHEVPKLG